MKPDYCFDEIFGNTKGDWFCIEGYVITSETEALDHLEQALGMRANILQTNQRRLCNIEHCLNLVTEGDNFINRLQRVIKHVFLNNNNSNNANNDNAKINLIDVEEEQFISEEYEPVLHPIPWHCKHQPHPLMSTSLTLARNLIPNNQYISVTT